MIRGNSQHGKYHHFGGDAANTTTNNNNYNNNNNGSSVNFAPYASSGGAGSSSMLKRIRVPHANDVLSGRGGSINSHVGNQKFRDIVKTRKEDYTLAASKAEKASVVNEVIAQVRTLDPPGRFLQRDSAASSTGSGWWIELDEIKMMAKTSQALREGAPKIRAAHKDELATIKRKRKRSTPANPPSSIRTRKATVAQSKHMQSQALAQAQPQFQSQSQSQARESSPRVAAAVPDVPMTGQQLPRPKPQSQPQPPLSNQVMRDKLEATIQLQQNHQLATAAAEAADASRNSKRHDSGNGNGNGNVDENSNENGNANSRPEASNSLPSVIPESIPKHNAPVNLVSPNHGDGKGVHMMDATTPPLLPAHDNERLAASLSSLMLPPPQQPHHTAQQSARSAKSKQLMKRSHSLALSDIDNDFSNDEFVNPFEDESHVVQMDIQRQRMVESQRRSQQQHPSSSGSSGGSGSGSSIHGNSTRILQNETMMNSTASTADDSYPGNYDGNEKDAAKTKQRQQKRKNAAAHTSERNDDE
eukprot:CAMPEP_0119570988 /NCGR_PEP_ID=MMETSP1352-20130426/43885_1 /TAXON_ID=265584 /ORGANISM="Stauroneis constricta, Strain CCMP1120" /LENGTH=529 /DNA_ID=CAMNT_0007620665 /DNA_START=1051 /DNA_END=2640 /DNA_ORIENTATION=+